MVDVPKSCSHAKPDEDQRKHRRGVKPLVKPLPDCQSNDNGKGDGKTQATEIPQLPEKFLGFVFHDKERLPGKTVSTSGGASQEVTRSVTDCGF